MHVLHAEIKKHVGSACPPCRICSSINLEENVTKSLFKLAFKSKAFWAQNDQSRGGLLEPEKSESKPNWKHRYWLSRRRLH